MTRLFKRVWIANGMLDAEMIRALLESFNIQTQVLQESAGVTYGMVFGKMGEVEILVPKKQTKDAMEILEAYNRGDLEV